MNHESPDLDALAQLLARGHEMVDDLCKRRGEPGWRRWEMSIPARPDHDPDLVIAAALLAGDAAVAESRRLRAVVDRLQSLLDAETGKRGPEGWLWTPHDTWSRYAGQGEPGPSASVWRHADQNGVEWSWRIDHARRGTAPTALEAMEAATAAREGK